MIILVTGSRWWTNLVFVVTTIQQEVAEAHKRGELVTIRHGHCPKGVDAMADFAADKLWLSVQRRPADYDKYGKTAPTLRNKEMCFEEPKPDLCLAFARQCERSNCHRPRPHYSHGTMSCIYWAGRAGIPTKIYRWEEVGDQ